MVEEAQKNASDEETELESEPSDDAPEDAENEAVSADPTARWAIRGAVVGAVAGSVVGAGVGVLVARRPEAIRQTTDLIGGNARQIATAAGAAAADVVASRGLNQLVSGENGDRGQLMKQSAMEAGAAAAKAARDSLVSLREAS